MHRLRTTAILVIALTLGAGTLALATSSGDDPHELTTVLRNTDGDRVGHVAMREEGEVVTVRARVHDLPPGFHGFHIHAVGRCDPPDFRSAMGHLEVGEQDHGDHAGDLPSLLVLEDGAGRLATESDRFSLDDLTEGDGAAVMVHSGRDNFANIPPRYGTPDEETLNTGDAGSRIACGAIG